ncbi:MAG: NAD-dependent epimerase/dehydratase family protein [Desulfuromonadaceae bacterium]|nr:NAD-dependent epimerase/dehydratase family protein [Desulfuromonadaceae bacterium]
MKKILVIGGSYFAGRVFVEELTKVKDVAVHVFNRGRIPLGISGVAEHRGDREDAGQIRRAISAEEWDAVVDFCAYTPSHVELLLNNLQGKIKQYIFISTTTIYQNRWNLPIREDALKVFGPQPELGPHASYGYDKWRAERVVQKASARTGMPYTILRPAIIYGFYNYAPREQYFFDLLQRGEAMVIPDGGMALLSFIWVVDMARLIIRCIGEEKALNQEFNLASDELVSYPRIIEVLEEITGKKIPVTRKSVEEINRERIPLPFPMDEHLVYSGAKLQRLLDFDHTPFTTGMREAFNYYLMVLKKRRGDTV